MHKLQPTTLEHPMSTSRAALLPLGLSLMGLLSAELVLVGLLRARRALA